MKNELVFLKGMEPVTTSVIVADGMGIEHRAVLQLIEKYKEDFEQIGGKTFAFEMRNSGGRPLRIFYLNEANSIFLCSLMRNSKIVVGFKKKLSIAFVKNRKMLSEIFSHNGDQGYSEQRKLGIIQRKEETDIIRSFVDYATERGSKHANTYYMSLTRMENQALFFILEKFPNLREVMDASQLIAIGAADQVVCKAIRDGMDESLPYKEIYQRAKNGVMALANVIGKSPLPKWKELPNGNSQIELF